MPDAPLVSVKFHAYLSGSTACSVGNVLIKDSASNDYYVIATTANRGTRRSEGVAITAYGGSSVGSVQLQQTGTLPQEITGLSTGFGSKQLVRVSATGTLERIATASVVLGTDDLIGYAETDGRVHLYPGFPIDELVTLISGSGATPGGTAGSVQIQATPTTFGGVTHGAVGSVLIQTGAATVGMGQVNLADTDAVTGVLPEANQADQTMGGDASGTTAACAVEAATGLTNLFTIRATAPTMQWVVATTTPRINQADVTTGSATGQAMTIQAQNATGATSTGGALTLTSGTGTSAPGSVAIQTGGTARLTVAPTAATLNFAGVQFSSNVVNPLIRQNDETTNSVNGDPLTIQAQNSTGTTTTGGALVLTSGTGTSAHGNVNIQVGGTTRLQLTPTQATGDILKSDGTTFGRFARGTSLQYLRVNSGGTDLEWATLAATAPGGSTTQVQYNNGGAFAGDADFTWDQTNNILAITGGVAIAGGTPHTTAYLRFPYNGAAARVLVGAKTSAAADVTLLGFGSGDQYTVGSTSLDGTFNALNGTINFTSASSSVQLGGGTMPADGFHRFAYNGGSVKKLITTRRSSAVDDTLLSHGSGDQYTLGNYGNILTALSSSLQISVASVSACNCDGTTWKWGVPKIGDSTMFACDGCATIALGSFSAPGNTNAAAAAYSRKIIDITGSLGGGSGTYSVTFPTPASEDASVRKVVINSTGYSSLDIKLAAGAVVTMSAGVVWDLIFRPGGVYRVS